MALKLPKAFGRPRRIPKSFSSVKTVPRRLRRKVCAPELKVTSLSPMPPVNCGQRYRPCFAVTSSWARAFVYHPTTTQPNRPLRPRQLRKKLQKAFNIRSDSTYQMKSHLDLPNCYEPSPNFPLQVGQPWSSFQESSGFSRETSRPNSPPQFRNLRQSPASLCRANL